ncbi:MAG: hypothetical protein MI747_14805 [Desulfobacterales bacterium]|nr:hypothetical protein [Desulfobacterales bacterium]
MNHLKDFRNDPESFSEPEKREEEEAEIETNSHFQQEITTLKIEKLANRVTIISVILPVLIGAVLVFVYMDIKERMTDSDMSKKSQVERLEQQVSERINALDMRIAKNRLDVDKDLPALLTQHQTLENQVAKLEAARAKDVKSLKSSMGKANQRLKTAEKRIQANGSQSKANRNALDSTRKKLTDQLALNGQEFQKTTAKLTEDMGLFKEEFDARLLELNQYENRIDQLKKQIALQDKRIKTLTRELDAAKQSQSRITRLESEIRKLTLEIKTVSAKAIGKSAASKAKTSKPAPKLIEGQTPSKPGNGSISQGDLTQ